jgi:hypothetical protein
VLGLNSLLLKDYGASNTSTGQNFAYTLCGLTIGTNWAGCPKELAEKGAPLSSNENDAARQLYAMAIDNFRSRPDTFFMRLADGAKEFLTQLPELVWKGYFLTLQDPSPILRMLMIPISLIGLLYILVRRAKPVELSLWALFWGSILLSASVVFFDDGARVLAASHPLIALFFAMGISSPASMPPNEIGPSRRISRYGWASLLLAAVLFISVPWVAHRFSPITAKGGDGLLQVPGEALVFGGRRMSGFLVVDDGSPLRDDLPTIHLADFEAIIQQSYVESYQGLLHPVMPPLPFGFIIAPRIEKDASSVSQFIVPADVVVRRDVPAWRFVIEPWNPKVMGDYSRWFYVTAAEPFKLGLAEANTQP